jgi:hypothetical protein
MAYIIERVKTKILRKPGYSKTSLQNGFYYLVKRLVFEYADFTFTAHYGSRIDSLMASPVYKGKLTVRR